MKNDFEIADWQESINSLSDKDFFYLMRLYLGEIKTPYNKQRLVSQLASFIRRPENLQSILDLLDDFDIKILTAIDMIHYPSQQVLFDFFEGEFTKEQLYSRILNLCERLLIYKKTNPQTLTENIYINPFLKDDLKLYFDKKLIFTEEKVMFFSTEDVFALSPNFLAAFISFVQNKGISCKADGSLKKNDVARLNEIFFGKEKIIQLLTTAFVNLSIFKEGDRTFEINNSRLQAFSLLPENFQYSLICAASVSRFSNEGLRKESQLLLDCLSSIPQNGFSKRNILRLAFLTSTKQSSSFSGGKKVTSRFSQILQAARQDNAEHILQDSALLESMIDSAIEFGLLQKMGKSENGTEIFNANQIILKPMNNQNAQKILSIDSTFTVTILPGLDLKTLLDFSKFMFIKKYDVVTEFEITKQSVSIAFDFGFTPERIFSLLSDYSNYEIPQNLKINITEWFNTYNSSVLYEGYVLKVSENNSTLVENNPKIKTFIKEKLAPGIYFLKIPQNSDIKDFISQCGLEFLGKTKTSTEFSEFTNFPLLRPAQKISLSDEISNDFDDFSEQHRKKNPDLKNDLLEILEKMEIEDNQKASLRYRIEHQLILCEEHLKHTAVRTEIFEAKGTDYAGKVHLIESSIKDEDLMEIQLPKQSSNLNSSENSDSNQQNENGFSSFLGHAIGISKNEGESVLRFVLEPSGEICNFLVSKITSVKRIRY